MAQGKRSAASIIRGDKVRDRSTKQRKAAQAASVAAQIKHYEAAIQHLPVKHQALILACKSQLLDSAAEAARYLGRVVTGAEPVDKTADRIRACSIVLDAAGILQQSQQSATDAKEINELSRAELVELARDGLRMLAGAAQADRVTVEGELVGPDE